MRALLVFAPPHGGTAEHVRLLARGLRARGWGVDAMGPSASIVLDDLAEAAVEVVPSRLATGLAHPASDVAAFREIARQVRRGGYDVVHAHGAKAGVLATTAGMTGLPVVYTPHLFGFVGDLPPHRKVAGFVSELAVGRRADAVICVSEWERRVAISARVAKLDRLYVVHNGTDACDDGATQPDEALTKLRARGPLVGAVTVLREQKSVDVLLDAAPAILRSSPETTIAIVGNGPLEQALRRRAQKLALDADGRLVLLAFEPPAARYLQALDVYVLPSSWESFPIAVLEALACGVPQVATDVGGTSEAVVAATGVLVPPRRPEAIAAAVVELLASPERRKAMAAASRARHGELFTTERMVDRTIDVYEAVIGQARRRPSGSGATGRPSPRRASSASSRRSRGP